MRGRWRRDEDDEPLKRKTAKTRRTTRTTSQCLNPAHARSVYRKLKSLSKLKTRPMQARRRQGRNSLRATTRLLLLKVCSMMRGRRRQRYLPLKWMKSPILYDSERCNQGPKCPTATRLTSLVLVESKKFRMKIRFSEGKKLFEGNTVLAEEDIRQSRALFESAVRSCCY